MSRYYTSPLENNQPDINKKSVTTFFNERANKIPLLGAVQAVIYQDKNPEIAAQRNKAEKEKLLPLLKLDGSQRILDVGCGTGRWTQVLLPNCQHYHGFDSCAALVEHAKQEFSYCQHALFSTASTDEFSVDSLNEKMGFDRILCMGVTIYLNDNELITSIKNIVKSLNPQGFLLVRDPVGIDLRLTLQNVFSEDMSQHYSAIYRTEEELINAFIDHGKASNLKLIMSGDMYEEKNLNNRKDTKQKFFLFLSDTE